MVFILLAYTANAVSADFLVADGWDASNGTAERFTTSDINRLNESDDFRMQTKAWSGMEDFNESRYAEFLFSPNISGIVRNISITFEYRRNGALDGAMLQLWNGSEWKNESIGMPNASATDVSYYFDNLTYINSSNINLFKLRFLAFRNSTGTSQSTSHDFVKLRVNYNMLPNATFIYPTGGENLSGIKTILWNATDDKNLTIALQYNRNGTWANLSTNETNDGEYALNTSALEDGSYALRVIASDGELAAEATSGWFIIDNTPPSINYFMTIPKLPGAGRNFIMALSVHDANKISVASFLLNKSFNMSASGNIWIANETLSSSGNYSVNFTAIDVSGNSINKSYNISVISEGTDSYYYNSSPIFNGTYFSGRLSANTTVSINITISVPTNGTISMAEYRIASVITGKTAVKFVEIEANDQVKSIISSATLLIYYTNAEISGLNESSLAIYFYNDSSGWQVIGSSVNMDENYVSANVSHMSLWGIFGDAIPVSAPPIDIPQPQTNINLSPPIPPPCTTNYTLAAPKNLQAYENTTIIAIINVTNTGTCEWSARINISVPKKWKYEPITTGRIKINESYLLNTTIFVPADSSGNHTVYILASASNKSEEREVRIEVLKAMKAESQNLMLKIELFDGTPVQASSPASVSSTGFAAARGNEFLVGAALIIAILAVIFWRVKKKRFRERVKRQVE
ncbi:MAG: hypothetical protein QMD85_03180, partial [Candidatus Aenigmarchaeota archaeon]|nr:hypothetical protein [Candidatus Aenigmarchaeota archaeon]